MDDFTRLMFLSEHMDTKEDISEFEEILSHYHGRSDEITLVELLSLFTDKCPYYEVMWGLVHLVEIWPKNVYVVAVIKSLNKKIGEASFWMDCLCSSMFNDESYFKIFKENLKLGDKKSLLKLFEIMEKESTHHATLIQELRHELEQKKQ